MIDTIGDDSRAVNSASPQALRRNTLDMFSLVFFLGNMAL
jgi:hypothetical protein